MLCEKCSLCQGGTYKLICTLLYMVQQHIIHWLISIFTEASELIISFNCIAAQWLKFPSRPIKHALNVVWATSSEPDLMCWCCALSVCLWSDLLCHCKSNLNPLNESTGSETYTKSSIILAGPAVKLVSQMRPVLLCCLKRKLNFCTHVLPCCLYLHIYFSFQISANTWIVGTN